MHKINYGKTDLYFELKRSSRKTLAIEVHPDSSIHVIAPEQSSLYDVEKKILKRAKWIVDQQHYFEQFLPRTPEREYVSGETHYYLGRSYILKVSQGTINEVKLIAGKLQVTYKTDASPENIKKLLAYWYYTHAEKKFNTIAAAVYLKFKEYDFSMPEIEIRRMAKRWGSCNTTNKVTINPELIKSSSKCIEYVLTHEMCHLVEPSHKVRFYNVLSSIMPDWNRWKNKLEILSA